MVSGPTQQPVQPTMQTPAPSSVQQAGPSSPKTSHQTAATSVQPVTPISGVSVTPSSSIPASVQIPQVSVPQSGPFVQTSVQMPGGQAGTSKFVTSQPQFTYQPYQGILNSVPVHKIQIISINRTLATLISSLNNPSLVWLILLFWEVIQLLTQL